MRIFCTARDFNLENSEGIISPYGMIFWEYEKTNRRLFTQVPKICKECKLFPSCSGICSQKIIEGGENVKCILDDNFTVNDYISMNFNNQILKQKILKS
jgi:radical SAM protein with 4Fe4S-binding SPASM domain